MTAHVAIIGGGLAGLSSALTCADAGARVTLLEARPRLGGATSSFRRGGLWIDNGQHVFLRCFEAYRGLLARLGVTDSTVLQDRLAIPVFTPDGRRAELTRSRLPAPLHLAVSLARYRLLPFVDRLRILSAAASLARLDPDDPRVDSVTFGSWLHRHGQSPAAVEALWDLIARPALNLPASEASLALAVKVFRTGLLTEPDAGDIGYGRVPFAELHAAAASRALRRVGAQVRLDDKVRAVEPDGDRLVVRAAHGDLTADAVVLAVPHEDAVRLLPDGALANAERLLELGRAPIVNVHVIYDRRVTDLAFVAGVGSEVQFVFDRSEPAGLDSGQYLAISLSAADRYMRLRVEELRRRFLPALEALFPPARDARIVDFFVTREPAATFRQTPGTRALRAGPRTGVRNLYLAGAWSDTGWPATMEGAVRSGLAAAQAALGGLSRIPTSRSGGLSSCSEAVGRPSCPQVAKR